MSLNFVAPILIILLLALVGLWFAWLIIARKLNNLQGQLSQASSENNEQEKLGRELLETHHSQQSKFDKHCLELNQGLQKSLSVTMTDLREQIQGSLKQQQTSLNSQFEQLTSVTRNKLSDISQQVDQTLKVGFEKTTATFENVIKRLAIIDQAQQKISELSNHMVNLQEILVDNRSRGAFGEVQLSALLRNMIPEKHFSLQHTLSNGKRADCLLFLPQPTGNIVIDAKFPLNTYRQLTHEKHATAEKQALTAQFKRDIKTHIQDISSKYLIPGETADGAIMFIPAEVIFAEIHGNHPDLVEFAYKNRVWLTSPTTMMAILTTARAVIKDEATQQQVHIIQKHLNLLGQDFSRFQKRMDQLARHINQAQQDCEMVHTSSQKISKRFSQIESVDFKSHDSTLPETESS